MRNVGTSITLFFIFEEKLAQINAITLRDRIFFYLEFFNKFAYRISLKWHPRHLWIKFSFGFYSKLNLINLAHKPSRQNMIYFFQVCWKRFHCMSDCIWLYLWIRLQNSDTVSFKSSCARIFVLTVRNKPIQACELLIFCCFTNLAKINKQISVKSTLDPRLTNIMQLDIE